MARKFPSSNFGTNNENDVEHDDLFDVGTLDDSPRVSSAPSLPIILLSAASGISAGIIALYITYRTLGLTIQWSEAITVFCLSAAVGCTGALLSVFTGSRASLLNIAFSCGLILVTLLFFTLCTLVGAIAATFILTL